MRRRLVRGDGLLADVNSEFSTVAMFVDTCQDSFDEFPDVDGSPLANVQTNLSRLVSNSISLAAYKATYDIALTEFTPTNHARQLFDEMLKMLRRLRRSTCMRRMRRRMRRRLVRGDGLLADVNSEFSTVGMFVDTCQDSFDEFPDVDGSPLANVQTNLSRLVSNSISLAAYKATYDIALTEFTPTNHARQLFDEMLKMYF
uniref:Pectinesterase inhibitor domain-containing protein n=1 Tax=Ananas comosus var. bracteatus TaxID=296719 RepID=A0A6V7PUC6_ANACO|nr:unnamed protein product [Ananas comosus var. bracteatus]